MREQFSKAASKDGSIYAKGKATDVLEWQVKQHQLAYCSAFFIPKQIQWCSWGVTSFLYLFDVTLSLT